MGRFARNPPTVRVNSTQMANLRGVVKMKAVLNLVIENQDGTLFHSTISTFPNLDKTQVAYLEGKLIAVLAELNAEAKAA